MPRRLHCIIVLTGLLPGLACTAPAHESLTCRLRVAPQVAGGAEVDVAVNFTADPTAAHLSWWSEAGEVDGNGLGGRWIAPSRAGRYTLAAVGLAPGHRPFACSAAVSTRAPAASAAPASPNALGARTEDDCTVGCARIFRGYAGRDEIPVLDAPRVLSAAASELELPDDARVVGVSVGGAHRAYPIAVLAYHEVVNDRLGGIPTTVVYAPLAGHARAFLAGDGGFGHTGGLVDGFPVLYDRQTDSDWLAATGESIRGTRRGARLEAAPLLTMRWAAWRALQPDTTVVWPDNNDPARFRYDLDPWAWYVRADHHLVAPVGHVDLRLPTKARVLGIAHDGAAVAFPASRLPAAGVVTARVGSLPVAVLSSARDGLITALDPRLDERQLSFEGLADAVPARFMSDRETGSVWNVRGTCVEGPLRGKELETVETFEGYFFAWATLHPTSAIWAPEPGLLAEAGPPADRPPLTAPPRRALDFQEETP